MSIASNFVQDAFSPMRTKWNPAAVPAGVPRCEFAMLRSPAPSENRIDTIKPQFGLAVKSRPTTVSRGPTFA